MAYGFVYVLGHELMDGVYKIGMTDRSPMQRRDELSSVTSIPSRFDLLFYAEVDGALAVERHMHAVFEESRVSSNREFFQAPLHKIFKEFEKFKDEAECPLAVTSAGESYLLADEDRERRIENRLASHVFAHQSHPRPAPEINSPDLEDES